jgi:proteic killer suppression protein
MVLPLYVSRETLYSLDGQMIKSFRSKDTERLHQRKRVLRFRAFGRMAQRKLRLLDVATNLTDVVSPPGNRLEALKGERSGQHSIRINDQWRICFRWKDGNPYDVEIVDCH